MNTEHFKNQIEALGDKWGTPHRGFFSPPIHPKWDIDIYKNGLREEITKFQSKSVPINEIFLKPNLIGKNYLIYKVRYVRAGNERAEILKLVGMLQSSEIDFDDFQYCYLVADESGSILIGEGRINYSGKTSNIKWEYRYPEVKHNIKERIAFLEEFFRGKIWQGCYALDLSYLIGDFKSIFMNWDSNPFQKN